MSGEFAPQTDRYSSKKFLKKRVEGLIRRKHFFNKNDPDHQKMMNWLNIYSNKDPDFEDLKKRWRNDPDAGVYASAR